ncbi:4-(cytidine 5'-diphospho)-2-C-methyl-D-erythritol kinase [Sphingoaurantiacus capsulatus]|uniref:4-diphosphocytidyl-2-C-methyl-D-erythritol kinase n=1 Tax=Sphingoaurantiacus capsulatus TaxID=1771310 RepID=A0ABV7XCY8_9SPHN
MRLDDIGFAKLNLALHVRRRRADGYHDLETIFAFTELGDALSVAPAETLSLTLAGDFAGAVPPGPDNLVLRAAQALDDGQGRGAAITLEKRLPIAAGLGGGSADAAATLRLLNRLWNLDLPLGRLAEIGATLGADVAACVHSRTLRGEGRGEALAGLDDAGLAGTAVILVNPRVAVPTPAVFARWDGEDRGPLAEGDPIATAAAGRNDLEPPALTLAPVIGKVLDALSGVKGAQLVRMSGSGATCFALVASDSAAEAGAEAISSANPGWWVAATRLR